MLFRLSGCFFCKMHYSEHLTLFITISRCYIRYTRKTVFRTSCKIIPISLYSITISCTRLFTDSGHAKKLIPNIRSHIRMFGRGETKSPAPANRPAIVPGLRPCRDSWPLCMIAPDLLHEELGAGGVRLVAEVPDPTRMHQAGTAA